MNQNQEIKMELLKEFSHVENPVSFCREAYKFLTEGDEVEPRVLRSSESKNEEDGIYLVYDDGSYTLFETPSQSASKDGITGIGVVYDGHAFQVALKDLGEQPLIPKKKWDKLEDDDHYTTECEGLHDWDFVTATNLLKEQGSEVPLPEGWYIPTLAVLEVMCFWQDRINEAIKFAGGNPMPGSYHWSSTEYYRCTARYVYFGNGFAYNYYKYFGYVVRPVAAFNL
jgi:hypothetical protein